MDETQRWIADIIARQDGVIARRQARHSGMTPGQIRNRLETGRWLAEYPGVYRSSNHPVTTAARVRAAGLWSGPNGLLSGHAAAWWWGLTPKEPELVEIVIPLRENRRSRPDVRVIRRDVDWRDRASVRAAPVTALALSALFGAVALGVDGPAVLDRALQSRIGFAEVRAAHYRTLGIRGSARAGQLLRAAADRSAAASERLFIRIMKDACISGWRVNYPWDPADDRTTVDFAFVRELIAIEIDGWAWHHQPDRFQRDRRKQNDLTSSGWTVLRFTWFDLMTRPEGVVADVRGALARARR
jgi:very-short-patch-repair endonuclease